MAIQVVSITKQAEDKYSVTIQDTADVVGTDEKDADIYRTYTHNYNPNRTAENLKGNFEAMIAEKKDKETATSTIETKIKATLETIDPSGLGGGA